ncbi:MAG: hypothetical protein IJW32_05955 [Clostridia bacterium]|nr:hypothetical protein [Clostridia bacterium]MBQ9793258.1 hypothetical protein [Clostridia bacterium]
MCKEDLDALIKISESVNSSDYLVILSKEALIALLFCAINKIDSLNVQLLNGDDCFDERDVFDQVDDEEFILSNLANNLLENLKITVEIED